MHKGIILIITVAAVSHCLNFGDFAIGRAPSDLKQLK